MIMSYFCIGATFLLLSLTGLQGYFQFYIFKAGHSQFALFTAIFYMFTETLVMFYFIGAGTAIKKTIASLGLKTDGYEKVKNLTLNMALIGTVFILGGAVQTGSISGWIHGLLFDIAFLHFLYTTMVQHRGFKENVEIISELAQHSEPVSEISA